MPFWRYHANEKQPEIAAWSSGLHRYFNDEQAAQILRDIVKIKKGTADEALAREFYEQLQRSILSLSAIPMALFANKN